MDERAKVTPGPSDTEQFYVIWSWEHMGWWRSDRCGYTDYLEQAGRYTGDEAHDIARALPNFTEMPIPDHVAQKFSRPTFHPYFGLDKTGFR